MLKYIIALKLLKIKNKDIIYLLENHIKDIPIFFSGDNSIFKESLDLIDFSHYFLDENNVKEAISKAENILNINEKEEIKTTFYTDSNYPESLKEIKNPPAIIYYKGNEFKNILTHPIACVGTRKPSIVSYNSVNYIIPQLVSEGCCIISGLAEGIDKVSHQSCLEANGKTIAVLAHGLDFIYPKENEYLAKEILNSNGIIMSEYPVGTKVNKYHFIDRNKLIVGLAKSVLIFECNLKSGSISNANYAKEQNKPIFCPSILVDSEAKQGTNALIHNGIAKEIKHGRDLNEILNSVEIEYDKTKVKKEDIQEIYLKTILKTNEINILKLINFLSKYKISVSQEEKIEIEGDKNQLIKTVINICNTNKINKMDLIKFILKQ